MLLNYGTAAHLLLLSLDTLCFNEMPWNATAVNEIVLEIQQEIALQQHFPLLGYAWYSAYRHTASKPAEQHGVSNQQVAEQATYLFWNFLAKSAKSNPKCSTPRTMVTILLPCRFSARICTLGTVPLNISASPPYMMA